MALADIAGSLMTFEYCESKIKGKPTLKKTPQSLSCFEQTLPVSVIFLPPEYKISAVIAPVCELLDRIQALCQQIRLKLLQLHLLSAIEVYFST